MTMTLLFDDAAAETAASVTKSPARRVFAVVAAAFATWQAARARRVALASLMEMDAHRLNDLGINPHDVADALNRR